LAGKVPGDRWSRCGEQRISNNGRNTVKENPSVRCIGQLIGIHSGLYHDHLNDQAVVYLAAIR
jgi:hypothetical protein